MMNKFCIIGRLTKDPEIKELENGNKVANITLAVDKEYKDKNGNKITDFIDFALWNKDAERLVEFSKKGSLIQLEGSVTPKTLELDNSKVKTLSLTVNYYKNIVNSKNYEEVLTSEEFEQELAK